MRYQLVEQGRLGVEHHWRRIVNDAMSIISTAQANSAKHTKRSRDSIISNRQLGTTSQTADLLKSRLLFAINPDADESSSSVIVLTDPFASRSIAASYPLAVSCTPSARSDNMSTASCRLGADATHQLVLDKAMS